MQRLARITILIVSVTLTGCTGAGMPEPTLTIEPLPSATSTLAPTDTPSPSKTPQPTTVPPAVDTPTSQPSPTPKPTSTSTVAPTQTPTSTVELTSIGEVTADRVGERVTVEGTVVDTASFSKGFKFTLEDDTGRIVLLMWHDVYDDCWDASMINLGAEVRASGEIGQYEGEMQIEPDFGGDVKAIESAVAQASRREIGSISGADEGQRVTIEGEVVRTEGLSTAVKVFLRDDSGEILIFIWRNVLDRIADNTALGTPSSRVRIAGTVDIYRSNLELVPTLPNDVTVLEMPQQ